MINTFIRDKIYFYSFIILAFVVPLYDKLVPPVILVIGLTWILEFNFKDKIQRVRSSRKRKNILAFGILYLLYVLGTSYSTVIHGQEGALFDLEVKMSLLIFPLLFSTIDFSKLREDFAENILDAFVGGSFLNLLFLLAHSIYRFFYLGEPSTVFFYTGLTVFFHPSYLAMFYAFSIGILVIRMISSTGSTKLQRYLTLFLIFLLQLFIVLLSSKAGILGMAVVYIVITVYLIVKKSFEIRILFLVPLFLLATFVITLFMFPQSYGRFTTVKSSLEHEETISSDTHESSAARVLVWKSALEIIKKNPVIGVGTGDVKQELMKVYKENRIEMALEEHLNAHNQYVQTAIALGITGLLVLISYFVLPSVYAYKNDNLLYLIFLALAGFHLLFESMLERQAGVVFYAFLNSFLFYFTVEKEK
jgi:O-antigen ligase